jgi:hypothetical protein
MSHIIDTESSCHGEATGQQVWKDAMIEEYQSIMGYCSKTRREAFSDFQVDL